MSHSIPTTTMNSTSSSETEVRASTVPHRILIVDDNPAIHSDFRKILTPFRADDFRADELESQLFGTEIATEPDTRFELDHAHQGQEALVILNEALAEGRPYALAFVDVRMPPGWDGIETINHLWRVDPGIQIVICTAYSDYSWEKMRATLMQPDSLVVLKKPFDNVEVQQLAHTLARKWELNLQAGMAIRQLDKSISKLIMPASSVRDAGSGVAEPAAGDPDLELPAMSSSDGRHFVASLARLGKVTEATRQQLRQSEMQLVQSEKMASLGRLSAGIIHEINNPLNFALAALSLLELESDQLPDNLVGGHLESLKDMRDALERIFDITGSLRKFAHPEGGGLAPVLVNNAVRTALRLMASEIKDGIVVENHIPEDLTVWASDSKLVQVFINLIHNAAHALRSKDFPDGHVPKLSFDCEVTDGLTRISLADNGSGIAGEDLGRIFDPFYTTKEVGQGTGLGLSICQQILKQFGASISVSSQAGEFTIFTISFKGKE